MHFLGTETSRVTNIQHQHCRGRLHERTAALCKRNHASCYFRNRLLRHTVQGVHGAASSCQLNMPCCVMASYSDIARWTNRAQTSSAFCGRPPTYGSLTNSRILRTSLPLPSSRGGVISGAMSRVRVAGDCVQSPRRPTTENRVLHQGLFLPVCCMTRHTDQGSIRSQRRAPWGGGQCQSPSRWCPSVTLSPGDRHGTKGGNVYA